MVQVKASRSDGCDTRQKILRALTRAKHKTLGDMNTATLP